MRLEEYKQLCDLLERLEDFKPPMAHHKHVVSTILPWRVAKLGEYLNTKQLHRLINLLEHILGKWEEEKNG